MDCGRAQKTVGDDDVSIILTVAIVPWEYTYVKTHRIVYFKCLQFIACQFYLNKVILLIIRATVALIISRTLRVRGTGWVSLGQMGLAEKQEVWEGGSLRNQKLHQILCVLGGS